MREAARWHPHTLRLFLRELLTLLEYFMVVLVYEADGIAFTDFIYFFSCAHTGVDTGITAGPHQPCEQTALTSSSTTRTTPLSAKPLSATSFVYISAQAGCVWQCVTQKQHTKTTPTPKTYQHPQHLNHSQSDHHAAHLQNRTGQIVQHRGQPR